MCACMVSVCICMRACVYTHMYVCMRMRLLGAQNMGQGRLHASIGGLNFGLDAIFPLGLCKGNGFRNLEGNGFRNLACSEAGVS